MFHLIMTIIWGILMCVNGVLLCETVLRNRNQEKKMRIFWFLFCVFWFIFETLRLGGFILENYN